jgi:hypothetical protein
LVNFTKAKRMEKVDFNGKMVLIMKVTLLMDILMDLASTTLQTWINIMRVNLDSQIWKVKGWRHGLMEEDMKEILRMARKTGKEFSCGLLESNILEVGDQESSTPLVSCTIVRMALKNKESGAMERELDGSRVQSY